MKRPDERKLTPEEEALWRAVTRDDVPLRPDGPLPQAGPGQLSAPARAELPVIRQWNPGMHVGLPAAAGEELAPLAVGVYVGIDRATAERFRKGAIPFDGTLDLHGMNRDQAYLRLMRFLERHREAHARCLLVITGKGPRGGGVLKELLPRWLARPDLKSGILALDRAQPRHGGSGAYYLLLRRKR